MMAEARALLQGLKLCVHKGVLQWDVEMDSLVLMQIIQGKAGTPWAITYEIREISQLLQKLDHFLMHTFRESNMAADCLANLGCKCEKYLFFEADGYWSNDKPIDFVFKFFPFVFPSEAFKHLARSFFFLFNAKLFFFFLGQILIC